MFSFLYVAIWMAIACIFHAKVRRATPKIDGFLSFVSMLGFYLSFAVVGLFLPVALHEKVGLDFGPDWLMRLSQVIGAACAFYVARRGTFLWGVLLVVGIVLGVAGGAALMLWRFVIHGGST